MIGYVRGVVTHIFKDSCYIDVHGVGYRVYVPATTRQELAEGQERTLFTYTNVREDAIQLYGFRSLDEYDLFLMLISVSGIGPKVGLGMLSGMMPDAIRLAIIQGQVSTLTKLPGIGKKSAERLVLELKDKLKDTTMTVGGVEPVTPVTLSVSGTASEALESLVVLGYTQQEVEPIIERLSQTTDDVAQLVKLTLKELGKGR